MNKMKVRDGWLKLLLGTYQTSRLPDLMRLSEPRLKGKRDERLPKWFIVFYFYPPSYLVATFGPLLRVLRIIVLNVLFVIPAGRFQLAFVVALRTVNRPFLIFVLLLTKS